MQIEPFKENILIEVPDKKSANIKLYITIRAFIQDGEVKIFYNNNFAMKEKLKTQDIEAIKAVFENYNDSIVDKRLSTESFLDLSFDDGVLVVRADSNYILEEEIEPIINDISKIIITKKL